MADVPPPGPPPPKNLPEGWKAVWNTEYSEWFYVNLHTKVSSWEKPTAPAPNPNAGTSPSGPPPAYMGSGALPTGGNEKFSPNNPYNDASKSKQDTVNDDARLAAQLQDEENARARGSSPSNFNSNPNPQIQGQGAGADYYNSYDQSYNQQNAQYGPNSPGYGQQPQGQYPPGQEGEEKGKGKGGLVGKLIKIAGGKHGGSHPPQQAGYGQGYPPQGGYNTGYPQQGYGGYPTAGYGQMAGQRPPKKGGMGMGAGGVALGAGAGLLGGALIANSFDHHGDSYQGGYQDGSDGGGYGGDDGGDFGGDNGGGFGGDDGGGGGDFGGGDF